MGLHHDTTIVIRYVPNRTNMNIRASKTIDKNMSVSIEINDFNGLVGTSIYYCMTLFLVHQHYNAKRKPQTCV